MCVCVYNYVFSVPKALRTEMTEEVKGKKVRPSSTAARRGGGRRKRNKVYLLQRRFVLLLWSASPMHAPPLRLSSNEFTLFRPVSLPSLPSLSGCCITLLSSLLREVVRSCSKTMGYIGGWKERGKEGGVFHFPCFCRKVEGRREKPGGEGGATRERDSGVMWREGGRNLGGDGGEGVSIVLISVASCGQCSPKGGLDEGEFLGRWFPCYWALAEHLRHHLFSILY